VRRPASRQADEVQTQVPRLGVVDEPARLLQFIDQRPSQGDARAAEHLQVGLRNDPARLWIRLGRSLAQKVMAEILCCRVTSRTRPAVGAYIVRAICPATTRALVLRGVLGMVSAAVVAGARFLASRSSNCATRRSHFSAPEDREET
jgi:hypothetical protein